MTKPNLAPAAAPVLMHVVAQHAEEAALLRHVRTLLVRAPHVGLLLLGRHDERIEAHLDGLAVAGVCGSQLAARLLDDEPSASTLFVAAVLALRQRDDAVLTRLLALTSESAELWRGLRSAFGWVASDSLQGVVRQLLASPDPTSQALAIEACRMHRVDPGPALAAALASPSPVLRTSALRAAGDLARHDLLAQVHKAMADGEAEVVFHAACAACQLGERRASGQVILAAALRCDVPGQRYVWAATALLMATRETSSAQELARDFSAMARTQATPASQRRLIRALALLGDTRHVPWLLERMHEPMLARLAGEAFTWITGIDLAAAQLEQLEPPPDAPDAGPSEEPADDVLDLDEDGDLPWPDPVRIKAQWQQRPQSGERLFMGHAQTNSVALLQVLQTGTQRQRRHAALLQALASPRQPLLPVAAPAWRQRRWLAQTSS